MGQPEQSTCQALGADRRSENKGYNAPASQNGHLEKKKIVILVTSLGMCWVGEAGGKKGEGGLHLTEFNQINDVPRTDTFSQSRPNYCFCTPLQNKSFFFFLKERSQPGERGGERKRKSKDNILMQTRLLYDFCRCFSLPVT